jgi:hypothetical protein
MIPFRYAEGLALATAGAIHCVTYLTALLPLPLQTFSGFAMAQILAVLIAQPPRHLFAGCFQV